MLTIPFSDRQATSIRYADADFDPHRFAEYEEVFAGREGLSFFRSEDG